MRAQQGVGMLEVLVALLLLAIGVLGFTALQLRAVDASTEANSRVTALTLARDLTERMRSNPQAVRERFYVTSNTVTSTATSAQLAAQDLADIDAQAAQYGMAVLVEDCPVSNSSRQCIYVAWDKTAVDFDAVTQCYANGRYVQQAKCLYLEAYE
jgi:type IV pilus assembly protein PilV